MNFFKRKIKSHLVEGKFKVEEAFRIGGTVYYMFASQFDCPTGRQLAALGVYQEMEMRCDKEYLKQHVAAMNKLLSNSKKIELNHIVRLNINLEERLNLMPMPEFIYKLASVVFFDETESLYSYDFEYAEKKIAKWKEAGGTLDFFMKTPLRDLIPFLNMPTGDSNMYFQVAKQIDKIHRAHLTNILSEEA